MREETYGRALARITVAQQADPFAAAFREATTSSSDGQHFPLGGRGESTGAVNPHKGSGPASSFYTHISGRYAPYHSKPISVADGEALHVLDGLLCDVADLNAAVHHTDGGGVSDHVFALCYLASRRASPIFTTAGSIRLALPPNGRRWNPLSLGASTRR